MSSSTATRPRAWASQIATIDAALNSAFGQRQDSIIYTQRNQYRVVDRSPADASARHPRSVRRLCLRRDTASRFRSPRWRISNAARCRLSSIIRASCRRSRSPTMSRREHVSTRTARRSRQAIAEMNLPRRAARRLRRRRRGFPQDRGRHGGCSSSPRCSRSTSFSAFSTKAYIHPITIISTLPSAGLGALLSLELFGVGIHRHRLHRHFAADRHRQEERHHARRLRACTRSASGGLSVHDAAIEAAQGALPPDSDDDARGDVRRAAARLRHRRSAPSCAARSASPSSADCC